MTKVLFILFFILGLFANSSAQSQLKRLELTKESNGKLEKQVFISDNEIELLQLIEKSGFPKEVKNQIKEEFSKKNLEEGEEFEFDVEKNGKLYSVQVSDQNKGYRVKHDSYQVQPYPELEEFNVINLKPKAFLGLLIKPYLHQNQQNKLTVNGVLVEKVVEGEAAYNAGIQVGDVITSINNIETPSPSLFKDALSKIKPREIVTFEYVRNGEKLQASSVAGKKENQSYPFMNPDNEGVMHPYLFMTPDENFDFKFEDLQNKAFLGVTIQDEGNKVQIESVEENSPAKQAGLKKGDVIKSIDGQIISTSKELIDYISSKEVGDQVNLKYERNGKQKQVNATLSRSNKVFIFNDESQIIPWIDEEGLLHFQDQIEQLTPKLEKKLMELKPQIEPMINNLLPFFDNQII